MKCYDFGAERFGWSRRNHALGSMRDGPVEPGAFDFEALLRELRDEVNGLTGAVLATAAGLTVAIPSLIGYRFYRSRVDALRTDGRRADHELAI